MSRSKSSVTLSTQYPRARLDALTDGVFSVAMTLLVLDVRLPDDFHPANGQALLRGLAALWPKMLPYALSFYVLGVRWLASIHVRSRSETAGGPYIRWWLLYLFLITCVPFSTIVVGRFAGFAPAIWIYAGNTLLIGIVSWVMLALTPEVENELYARNRRMALRILMLSTVVCIIVSAFDPDHALYAFLLNTLVPVLAHRATRQHAALADGHLGRTDAHAPRGSPRKGSSHEREVRGSADE